MALWAVGILFAAFIAFTAFVLIRYSKYISHVFLQKPLLLAETQAHKCDGTPAAFKTPTGRTLVGSYMRRSCDGQRRGLILFCHEYSGDRWLWESYAKPLVDVGFDLFAFDFCNHGQSDSIPGYEPNQWVTDHEVEDVNAAIAHLQNQPDADPNGVVLFGVSKGGSAGIAAAGKNRAIRAIITDGAYPTHGMVTEYEMKWVNIFTSTKWIYTRLPRWFYGLLCEFVLFKHSWKSHVHYPRIESGIRRLGVRPLLMIHGGRDNYVTKPIVERFFRIAGTPNKERWLVESAKHNRSVEVNPEAYHRKVQEFLDRWIPQKNGLHQTLAESASPTSDIH